MAVGLVQYITVEEATNIQWVNTEELYINAIYKINQQVKIIGDKSNQNIVEMNIDVEDNGRGPIQFYNN